jgi:SAM-dependent methyltransferase
VIRVLVNEGQIAEARRSLSRAGCDSSRGWWRFRYVLLFALRFRTWPEPVAVNKSWDVWNILQLVRQAVPDRAASIFEMGSYNSEIPLALWRAGYRRIRAADLNPVGRAIRWYGNAIDFRTEDFHAPDLTPGSVDVMTAVSVIEHGYHQRRLLDTVERLLRPGGVFCLTTDYHQEKLSVPEELRLFGLTYRIFSRSEIEELVAEAGRRGLEPLGDLRWEPSDYPIEWLGRRYTFLLLALRKRPGLVSLAD